MHLPRLQEILRVISTGWGALVAMLTIMGVLFTVFRNAVSLNALPEALHHHDSTTAVYEHKMLEIQETELCIQVAQLQHTDWASCLIKNEVGP